MTDPFQRLKEIEQRCIANAEALPSFDRREDDWQGIGFKVGDVELLSTMGDVVEILDPPEYTRIPGVKPWVVGIANVRGGLLPLMDLRGFITGQGLKNRRDGRVMVVRHNGLSTGLIVDEVLGIRHFFMNEQATDLPELNQEFKPYIKKAFRRDDQYWPVFSFDTLIEDEHFLHASL